MEVTNATGAAKSIFLSDKEYTVGELTIGDWAAFETYVRRMKAQRLIEASKLISNLKTTELLKIINSPIDKGEVDSEMSTINGACFLLWRGVGKNNKNINLENVQNLIKLDDL